MYAARASIWDYVRRTKQRWPAASAGVLCGLLALAILPANARANTGLSEAIDACRSNSDVAGVNTALLEAGFRNLAPEDAKTFFALRSKQMLHGIAAKDAEDGLTPDEIANLQSMFAKERQLAPRKADLAMRRLNLIGDAFVVADGLLIELGTDVSSTGNPRPYCLIRGSHTDDFDTYWATLEPVSSTSWATQRYNPDGFAQGGLIAATRLSPSPFEELFNTTFEPTIELYVRFQPALPAS